MIGAIAGDVLGSIYQFNPVKTNNFDLLNSKWDFTDDTTKTVAVANSLMNDEPYMNLLQMWIQKFLLQQDVDISGE